MLEKSDSSIHLGLDIGAENAKVAVVNKTGQVLYLASVSISSSPVFATTELLELLQQSLGFSLNEISTAGVTGRGQELYKGQNGWQLFTSPYAAIAGLREEKPRMIIDIGGQSSRVTDTGYNEGKPWRSVPPDLCAAGTGKFLEQQARRLGVPIGKFGETALAWKLEAPRIASRCSVFAKSDLIHLQQKGYTVPAMLAGLSESVARMIKAQWRDEFKARIYFIGGVAANEGVARALSNVIGQEIVIPEDYDKRGAIGAAILSQNAPASPEDFYPKKGGGSQFFYIPNTLARPVQSADGWMPKELEPGVTDVYMGVDVGSTSTKIVIISPSGEVLAKKYIMTAGQPLKAIQEIMADPDIAKLEARVNIKGVGVTGSGRYLVGHAIGADLIKNEITAQTRAVRHIDPEAETMMELGGQDSKYAFLKNGIVLDYQMNRACAAGTGSFIDELAEQLGVSTKDGEFARLAFDAEKQLDLGEKCTAFMGQAVAAAQNEGAPVGVITASLATSLVENYLSKVVGGRRIGERVFLTGAVFYNEAVVAAFRENLPGKDIIVPRHKEVTGAIGAALLAKESMQKGEPSKFKGFSEVANAEYKLKFFNCKACPHTCAISAMRSEDGTRFYHGSRCDLFDAQQLSAQKHGEPATPFTIREGLLFDNYDPEKGIGLVVGIPRALMAYDLAPMLTGFLNALGVRVRYTSSTTSALIEKSTQYAYSESCLPVKVLHGHVAELVDANTDYILVPNAIRLGKKTTEADQHFACPLIQNAPYIVRSVFGLGDKLLDPIIDFSRGDEAVKKSFIEIAKRLGFDTKDGERAIEAGLIKQREFEAKLKEAGEKLLDELADDPDAIGVVLLSRAYNAQDSGVNLGMTQALRRLGVIPIPLDYLPLDSVNISDVTDRPYWNYERKILAASRIVAGNPQLFGLFLSNFGCGPNSFIQKQVEIIMGHKPFGQIEVDEHAAEAGIITRLEAAVDTFRGYAGAGLEQDMYTPKRLRSVLSIVGSSEEILLPPMADHASVLAAAMRAFGVNAAVLPPSSERSLVFSRDTTNGKECLPFRDCVGAYLLAAEEGRISAKTRALMAGAFGPCRLGKYAEAMQQVFDERDIPLTVMTTVSDNSYADLGLGLGFEIQAWKGIVATDLLQKMLWATRPYEKFPGQTDQVYQEYLGQLTKRVEGRQSLKPVLNEAAKIFSELSDSSLPRRPLVDINGEIYLRSNEFCNQNLVRLCEENGLEVEVAPMAEWIKYITLRRLEDAKMDRNLGKWLKARMRKYTTEHYEHQLTAWTDGAIHGKDYSPEELIRASSAYIPSRNGSEAVLSTGSGILRLEDPEFAGVISVMPHGCMPGGVVAALAGPLSKEHGDGKPWMGISFDGSPNTVNPEKVAIFAEQIRSQKFQALV